MHIINGGSMKKLILISLIFIIFLLGGICIIKKDNNKKNYFNNNQTVSFYKEELLDRYISYKEKNKDLSNEEVVIRVNIGLDKDEYTYTYKSKNLDTSYILVNKYNYLEKDYAPKNLEEIDSKYSLPGKKLNHDARIAFENMARSAKEEGLNIRAISTYRTYSYQKELYDNYVKNEGIKKADTYSARPGFSEHQTGLSVDCDNKIDYYENFEKTKEFLWMDKNAHKFGFILRYPKGKESITKYSYESWHYRYVGVEIASFIKKNNITFEEYYVRFIDI